MSLGSLARKVLPKKAFSVAADLYRSVFVDLNEVAKAIAQIIPENASVLDIGGGDGKLINLLLTLRNDLRVTMIDLNQTVGSMVDPAIQNRVTILPRTSIRDYLQKGFAPPQAILIADVLHHIAPPLRDSFFQDLKALVSEHPMHLIVKDVEPGMFRSQLSYWADIYVSGDKTVQLISKAEILEWIDHIWSGVSCTETPLYSVDAPNFALLFNINPQQNSIQRPHLQS